MAKAGPSAPPFQDTSMVGLLHRLRPIDLGYRKSLRQS